MMMLMTQSMPTMEIHTNTLVIAPNMKSDINDFSLEKLLNFIIVSSDVCVRVMRVCV